SEELWQHISDRQPGESIMYAIIPEPQAVNADAIKAMNEAREIVTAVRNVRASKNIPNKNMLQLQVANAEWKNDYQSIILKLAGLDSIEIVESKDPTAASFLIGTTEFAVPLNDNINVAEEIEKLEKELQYTQGFLASVEKKLSNERFVANAPEAVVAAERKKQADAQSKIATLQETLAALKG
ncbi:MAG: class I tRNA ligase family protein, partial [Muribaculaceae bacterium]|nr:class I tRNA ligase family protein [Muribaculaceae bacterium]